MQRTAGNRAIGIRLAAGRQVDRLGKTTVQRTLAPSGATIRALDQHHLRLAGIATAIDTYNAGAGRERSDDDYQASFANLQAVDRAVNKYFRAGSWQHQRLTTIPHYQDLSALMASVTAEHQALVERTKNMVDVLPLDVSALGRRERTQLKALWQDIVNNRGNLQVLGSNQYQERVRAELARILATKTGRQLLAFLNAPKPGVLGGSPADDLSKTYIAEDPSQLPGTVTNESPKLRDPTKSEAQPLNVSDAVPGRSQTDLTEVIETPIDPHNPPDPRQFPPVDPRNLGAIRDIVMRGGRGYTHAGMKYEFTTGTGSFVASFPGQALMGRKDAQNEILNPSWVTLGHELGHAANMKAGAAQLRRTAVGGQGLLADLAGGADAAQKWDNVEEFLNITNIENALRAQAGISKRIGHQPPRWAQQVAVNIRRALYAPLDTLLEQDPAWYQHSDWKAMEVKTRVMPLKDANNQAAVDEVRRERDRFLSLWANGPLGNPTGGNKNFAKWKGQQ